MNELLTKILLALSGWSKDLGGFNFSVLVFSGDMLVGLFLMVAVLLIAFGMGKTKMLLAILSTYIAFLVAWSFPFYEVIKGAVPFWAKPFWPQAVVFWTIFLFSFFILNRSILRPKMSLREVSPLMILWLSMVETGFLISVMLSYGQPEIPNFYLSPWLIDYFGTTTARFVWSLLPVVSIFFVKPSRRSSSAA